MEGCSENVTKQYTDFWLNAVFGFIYTQGINVFNHFISF